jgi:hypothetical protein
MRSRSDAILLVGDNPFHGISHLSQERARSRSGVTANVEQAAQLIMVSIENGASGFMFSVSDTTLSILKEIRKIQHNQPLVLYALMPYAYEYVRLATHMGGIPGLAKNITKQIALSGNLKAIAAGLNGVIRTDPVALLKTYLFYEISRIKSSASKNMILSSVMLHEVITDMALALDLDWLFKAYIKFLLRLRVKPGFETRNFPYFVNKFRDWDIDFSEIAVAASFNPVGFQMNPSKSDCEAALARIPEAEVIAISILAAGHVKPSEAVSYLQTLPNLAGVAAGVSKQNHAHDTFTILKDAFAGPSGQIKGH